MADEARKNRNAGESFYAVDSTVTPFEVRQGPTGLAEVYNTATAALSGQSVAFNNTIGDRFTVQKTSGIKFLKGGRVYWDYSANLAHFKKVSDRDFYMGRAAQDSDSTAPTVDVLLNVDPRYDIDLARDGYQSVLVGTPAAGGFSYPVNLGGALIFELSATSEAQKVDALSVDGFDKNANAIIEGAFRVISDGSGSTPDFSIGLANGTHASDFETIAEFVALHLDGNATAINAESDDGTSDVGPTDTTTTYTEGSALASRKEFWIDLRDPTDIQIYIEGVLVLDGSTFTLNGATGPFFLIVHLEKTSSTDTYKVAADWLRARFAEQ